MYLYLAVYTNTVIVVFPFCGSKLYSNVQTQAWYQATSLEKQQTPLHLHAYTFILPSYHTCTCMYVGLTPPPPPKSFVCLYVISIVQEHFRPDVGLQQTLPFQRKVLSCACLNLTCLV